MIKVIMIRKLKIKKDDKYCGDCQFCLHDILMCSNFDCNLKWNYDIRQMVRSNACLKAEKTANQLGINKKE